jgi:hypothetical protein
MTGVCKGGMIALNLMWLMLAWPAWAQLQAGETSLNLNGNISFGYTGDFSNQGASDHSLTPGGNADLSGSYYDPKFLSFDVQPFFDQSRTNSNFGSTFESSGVSATSSIFSGSNFPGTISFNKTFNSSGQFGVPGQANLTTQGNSQNLAVGWGLHLPGYPNISAQFLDGDSNATLFGTNQQSMLNMKTLGLRATDTLAGFMLNAGYQYNQTNAVTPELIVGEASVTSNSSGNTFDVGAAHPIPMHGSSSITYSRSDISSVETGSSNYTGTIDTINGIAVVRPLQDLNVGVNTQYTNNLTGMLYQSYVVSGVVVPSSSLNYATNSLDVNTYANYLVSRLHLTFGFNSDHRDQTVLGTSLSADTLDETVTYGNDFFGGFLNATVGITQTFENQTYGSSTQGQFENVSYQRGVHGWNLTGSGNYTRNTQTVLIGYTSSGYGFNAGIGRKVSAYSYWSFNAVDTKTNYNDIPNSGSSAQSYATAFSVKRFSLSGSYAKSNGISILTPTGLLPVTTPTPIATSLQTVAFGGHSYSFGAATTPIRGLVLSASYSDAVSNTAATGVASNNTTRLLNGMLQYKVRQLWIIGGYQRLQQGFSITGQPPLSDTSFYMGITRWFKFF